MAELRAGNSDMNRDPDANGRSSSGSGISREKSGVISVRKKKNIRFNKDKKYRRRRQIIVIIALIILIAIVYNVGQRVVPGHRVSRLGGLAAPSWVEQEFIRVDGHSRSGVELTAVNDIVIHYVGNPGSTAQANRNYFDSDASNVSSHYVVGLDGEVIQCLPLDERSAASNNRNPDTISIEVCHPDETGKFNDATYQSLVKLTAWLCREAGLSADHVIRHYDVTGKICPKYFVDHEDAWAQFKSDVSAAI